LTAPLPTNVIESRISTADASCLAGVSVATIRKWVQRGHLEVACRDGLGRPLFRWIDVAKAERATRDRARRTYAA
jgi:predicted site-specific integrase-resolvase